MNKRKCLSITIKNTFTFNMNKEKDFHIN